MYKINQCTESIYHFEFKRKCDLFLSFMRMQEFYEAAHPRIKGKKFSLEDLIVAYCELDKDGEFKYMEEFAAFNIPDIAIKGFLNKNGKQLLEREKKVIVDIKKSLEYNDKHPTAKTYYIATFTQNNSDCKRDLKHELAHGLFYTQSMYHKIMITLIDNNILLKKAIFNRLKEMKYCEEVLVDETQAYLATASLSELKEFDFPKLEEEDIIPFREAFKQFTNSIKQKQKKGLFM